MDARPCKPHRPCFCAQVTLPTRFIVMTSHFIAVLTLMFGLVRSGGWRNQHAAKVPPRPADSADLHAYTPHAQDALSRQIVLLDGYSPDQDLQEEFARTRQG